VSEDFVIDTSVVMSWCFKDEINRYADAILDLLEEATAFAPSIWSLEVGNVLLVAERRKRLSEADSIRFITLLSELPIIVEQEPPERMIHEILALARALNYKIKEAPIYWMNHPQSHVGWSSYFQVLMEVVKIRWWLWKNEYKILKH